MIDFTISEELREFRESVSGFLADAYPVTRFGTLESGSIDTRPDDYEALVRLGWTDPDLGSQELAMLAEEAGAVLLSAPWFATVRLARPLLPIDDELRAAIDAGTATVSVAWAEDGRSGLATEALTPGTTIDHDGRLTGTKVNVIDGDKVSHLLVTATGPDGAPVLVAVDLMSAADGVHVRSQNSIDATRSVATVTLTNVVARHVTPLDATRIAAWEAQMLTAVAAEAVGVARAALGMAVEHARVREQFGRPIGSFQAIAHRLSATYKDVELARSLSDGAAREVALAVGAGQYYLPADTLDLARAARVRAVRAATTATESAIQVLGGMGVTWDHPMHRWYKRALLLTGFPGRTTQHVSVLGERLADVE